MIFVHDDYKMFLRQWIESRPTGRRGEVGKIAAFLNVNGSLISAILNGDRQLSLEQASDLTAYLELKKIEADYFIALVSYERAGNHSLKKYWEKQKKSLLKQSEKIENVVTYEKTLSLEQMATYYSHSAHSQIRILSTLENGTSFDEIVHVLKLSKRKVQEALEFLLETKLLLQKNNRYFATDKVVHLNKNSEFYLQHHKNWRLQQLNQATQTNENDITYTCPCTLDEESFKKIRKLLLEVIQKSHDIIREAPAKEFACLTIDFISYQDKD